MYVDRHSIAWREEREIFDSFFFLGFRPPLRWKPISWASLNQIGQSKGGYKRQEKLYVPSSNPKASRAWSAEFLRVLKPDLLP
jgi:hypothetical protein